MVACFTGFVYLYCFLIGFVFHCNSVAFPLTNFLNIWDCIAQLDNICIARLTPFLYLRGITLSSTILVVLSCKIDSIRHYFVCLCFLLIFKNHYFQFICKASEYCVADTVLARKFSCLVSYVLFAEGKVDQN